MTLLDKFKPRMAGIDWLGITRMLVIQLIVLVALSLAVTRYLTWTSDVARAEFTGAIEQADVTGAIGQTASLASKLAPCSRN